MILRFELEEGNLEKQYIKSITSDHGGAFDGYYELMEGYNGKTFTELVDEGEIEIHGTDSAFAPSVDKLVFKRPISIDRFILMFKGIGMECQDHLEHILKSEVDAGMYKKDRKKYSL